MSKLGRMIGKAKSYLNRTRPNKGHKKMSVKSKKKARAVGAGTGVHIKRGV